MSRPPVAEFADHEVGEAARDREQLVAGAGAVDGHGRLDEVPEAVELVALDEAVPAALAAALDPRVQVAVVLLRAAQQVDGRLGERGPAGVAGAPGLPADGLEHLVDVRVGEPVAAERAVGVPDEPAEVVQVPRRLEVLDAVVERRLAVEALPVAEQGALGERRAVVERPQCRVGARRQRHRPCRRARLAARPAFAVGRRHFLPHGNFRKSISGNVATGLRLVKRGRSRYVSAACGVCSPRG